MPVACFITNVAEWLIWAKFNNSEFVSGDAICAKRVKEVNKGFSRVFRDAFTDSKQMS